MVLCQIIWFFFYPFDEIQDIKIATIHLKNIWFSCLTSASLQQNFSPQYKINLQRWKRNIKTFFLMFLLIYICFVYILCQLNMQFRENTHPVIIKLYGISWTCTAVDMKKNYKEQKKRIVEREQIIVQFPGKDINSSPVLVQYPCQVMHHWATPLREAIFFSPLFFVKCCKYWICFLLS